MSRSFRFGLTGYPLGHSLSPLLHRAALKACGLKGDYQLFPVPPGEECQKSLSEILEGFRRGRLDGLNVTIPHKQTVMQHLDRLTPASRVIGAVNTVYRDGDQLVGDNTDAPGFLADLKRYYSDREDSPRLAYILGAGGSARAVTYALLNEGWRAVVVARRLEQAQEVVDQLRSVAEQPSSLALSLNAARYDMAAIAREMRTHRNGKQANFLIVNTTPLGMSPRSDETPWPEEIPLPEAGFVYDLVYNPAQTRLVAYARRAGLGAANGSGMLVEQAALAFERWTGLEASRSAMRQAMTSGG